MTRKRPALVIVEPIRARAIRGPRKDGAYYWRAELYREQGGKGITKWTGWAHRSEVADILKHLDDEPAEAPPAAVNDEAITTIRGLMETWVAAQDARVDLSKSFRSLYRNAGHRLCAAIGDVSLERVDLVTLERYRDERLRAGSASAVVRQDLKCLRRAWAWGAELELCPARVLPRVTVKIVPRRAKTTPERADAIKVLDTFTGWRRLAMALLVATGARIGEVASLKWADIDARRGLVRVRWGKTGARDVPIHADLVRYLASIARDPTEGVFGVTPAVVRTRLGQAITDACDNLGIEHFTPHGLRRAAVDAFQRAGVDVGSASAYLGHSPQVMLEKYRTASLEDKRRAEQATQLGAALHLLAVLP